jgi:hypothetical protein
MKKQRKTIAFMGKRLRRGPDSSGYYTGKVGRFKVSLWDDLDDAVKALQGFCVSVEGCCIESDLVYAKTLPGLERRAWRALAKQARKRIEEARELNADLYTLGKKIGVL